MALLLEISSEREAALNAIARSRGMTVQQWLLELVDQVVPAASIANLQNADPDEWARQFHQWAEGHRRLSPLLSDEAISRESIYPDRS